MKKIVILIVVLLLGWFRHSDLFPQSNWAGQVTPLSTTIESGEAAPTMIHSNFTSLSYRKWYQKIGTGYWDEVAKNIISYSPGVLINYTDKPIVYQYRIQTTHYSMSMPLNTNTVTITVNPAPVEAGTVSPSSVVIPPNTPITLTHENYNARVYTRQWQERAILDNGTDTGWNSVEGEEDITYNPGPRHWKGIYEFRVLVNGGYYVSEVARIYNYPSLIPGSVSGSQTISYGNTPAALTHIGASGGTDFYSLQWEKSTDNSNWNALVGDTLALYSPRVLKQTTYYRVKVVSGVQIEYTPSVTVTVDNIPFTFFPGTVSESQVTTLSGTEKTLLHDGVQGTTGIVTRQWQQSADNGDTWTNIAGQTGTTYPPGTLNQSRYYRVAVTNSGNTVATAPLAVTVLSQETANLTQTQNYVAVFRPREERTSTAGMNAGNTMIDVTYYDGLGRPIQQVGVGASPQGTYGDQVVPIVYDAAGRSDAKSYLPYGITTTGGGYQANALTAQQSFYAGLFGAADANYAYVEKVYEPSPLNRVNATINAGSAFNSTNTANRHPATYGYQVNNATDVKLLYVNNLGNLGVDIPLPAGSVFKNVTTNEDGLATEVFVDKQGKTLLERTIGDGVTSDTYYVYDDLQRLRYVITPEGSAILGERTGYAITSDLCRRYCYCYVYDAYGRLVEKYVPGADPEYSVYDDRDRLVASQNGKERAHTLWKYYQYDNLDRPTYQWEIAINVGRAVMQQNYAQYLGAGYSKKALRQWIYDTYSHSDGLGYIPVNGISADVDSIRTKGLLTQEIVYWAHTHPIERRYYYDHAGRMVQEVSTNQYKPLTEKMLTSRISNKFDFQGNLTAVQETHRMNATVSHTLRSNYTYDHRNRLLFSSTYVDGSAKATVLYRYNALGQLDRKIFGNGVETAVAYNIQGWLTEQSGTNFSQSLNYYTAASGVTPSYTGNISRWAWTNGGNGDHYTFSYDQRARMTSATHSRGLFGETGITYDRNGNIKTLNRQGDRNYWFTYNGNQIESANGIMGFTYDHNGNLLKDPMKNWKTHYDYVNLLTYVTDLNDNPLAYYNHAADRRKTMMASPGNTQLMDYFSDRLTVVRLNGKHMAEYNFGEGVVYGEAHSQILYHEKDHLGSVRVVTDANGDVLERNDYYPFGMRHQRPDYEMSTANRFEFNGKDKEPYGATSLSDYGHRLYDNMYGRWASVDPLAEKYHSHSPYNFVGGNPITRIDPDGQDWYQNNDGDVLWLDKSDETVTHREIEYQNIGTAYSYRMADGSVAGFNQNTMVSQHMVADASLSTVRGEFLSINPSGIEMLVDDLPAPLQWTLGLVRGVMDDAYIAIQSFYNSNPTHLNGSLATPKEKLNAGVNSAASAAGYLSLGFISGNPANAANFNAIQRGTGITAASSGGAYIRYYNQTVRQIPRLTKTYENMGYGLSVINYSLPPIKD